MTEHAPAFQFYPKDFLSDSNVIAMPAEVVGAYILLLSTLWLETRLPMRVPYLSRIARVNEDRFQEIWDQYFVDCFQLNDGFITHKRLDAERKKQKDRRESQSKGGKQGANARWGDKIATPMGNPLATPMGSDGSSSSFPSSSNKDSRQSPSAPPPDGGPLGEEEKPTSDLETAKRNTTDVAPPAKPTGKTKPRKSKNYYVFDDAAVLEIPPKLVVIPGFTETWSQWVQARREDGHPITRRAAEAQLVFLASQDDPVEIIARSIRNQWQGLFPLDSKGAPAPASQHRELPDMSGKTMGER